MPAKYFIILPDAIGARQIVQAVGRPAREIPELQLRRHGRGAVPAGDRGPRRQASAARDRQLDGRHADLDVGRDLSRLHGRAGADGLAADRDVEPQLDDAAADASTRSATIPTGTTATTPAQPRAAAYANAVLRHRHASAARWPIRNMAPTRERRPTSCSTSGWRRRSTPMPTTSSTSGTRRATTTPAPGLEQIKAALLAINSADDERNPPETGVMDARAEAREERQALSDPRQRPRRAATARPAWRSFTSAASPAIAADRAAADDVGIVRAASISQRIICGASVPHII